MLLYCCRWRFEEIFSNPAAINFDIGFGSGASLIEMATERPNENFVGIEVEASSFYANTCILYTRCFDIAWKHLIVS